jgi:hypothetical protein
MALRSVRVWMTLVAVTAATAGSMLAGPSANAAAALPVVKVSPSTGLADLQQVTVTGTGFSPNVQIGVIECRPGALSEPDCDLSTVVLVQADKHGAFTLKRSVRRLITVASSKIDCADAAGCIVGAGNVGNLEQANGQTIFFDPKIPPKVPKITVTPNTKLIDHQLIGVTGKGFAPSTSVSVAECVTHPPTARGPICDYSTQRYLSVTRKGTFAIQNFALQRRQVVFTKAGSRTVDCATAAGTCEIQVFGSGFGSSTPATTPLTFDPSVKAIVAAAHASPSVLLRDLQLITLTGAGFVPGVGVNIQECAVTTTKFPSCDFTTSRAVTAGFHGEFTMTFAVRRDITAFVTAPGPTKFDCATKVGACELAIQGSQAQPQTKVALGFNPNVKAITPSITAAPDTGLHDNQSITVSLRGFTPNQPAQIVECAAEAIREGNLSYCDYNTLQLATSAGSVTTRSSFVVRKVIGGQAGLVNCAAKPGACVLVASSSGNYYGGGAAVTPGPTLPNIAFTKLTFATS